MKMKCLKLQAARLLLFIEWCRIETIEIDNNKQINICKNTRARAQTKSKH